jgi:antitoxin VapB
MPQKEDDRMIVEPVRKASLLELLAQWEPLGEEFPEIGDALSRSEDIFGPVSMAGRRSGH